MKFNCDLEFVEFWLVEILPTGKWKIWIWICPGAPFQKSHILLREWGWGWEGEGIGTEGEEEWKKSRRRGGRRWGGRNQLNFKSRLNLVSILLQLLRKERKKEWLFDWIIDWLINQLNDWLIDWLKLIDWLRLINGLKLIKIDWFIEID